MANFDVYFPILLGLEGGWSEDPDDRGGATKYGVTLQEWINEGYDKDGDGDVDKQDLKIISTADASNIAKKLYWDKVRGDEINSQTIAEFVADWAYNSGVKTSVKHLQSALDIKEDGVMGPITLKSTNMANPSSLFGLLLASRERFYRAIVSRDGTQEKFLKGWLSRLKQFKFKG